MYFDVVLNGLKPIFKDTPEQVRDFLERAKRDKIFDPNWVVVPGRTLQIMTANDYLART